MSAIICNIDITNETMSVHGEGERNGAFFPF